MSPSITPMNNPFGEYQFNSFIHLVNSNYINVYYSAMPTSQPAPPKPQRSFAANLGSQAAAAGLIVIQPGHSPRPTLVPGAPMVPPAPSPSVPQHLAYHQSRPLPDRPYSVAGHYPSLDRIAQDARISYPQGANPNGGDFSGYLSSPEHRHSSTILAMHPAVSSSQPLRSLIGYPSASRPFDTDIASNVSGAVFPHHHTGPIYPSRNQSTVMDEEARVRMQEMERQIASLTSAVSKALSSNDSRAGPFLLLKIQFIADIFFIIYFQV